MNQVSNSKFVKKLHWPDRELTIKIMLKNEKKNNRDQFCVIMTKIIFNVVRIWLTSDYLIPLLCRSFSFDLCSGASRFIHHLNSQLCQFHRIAVLIINTIPTPFPIPNFIVTTENFRDFDIFCTSSRTRFQSFLHEWSIDISPIFVRLMHRQVFCSWICRTRDSRDCRDQVLLTFPSSERKTLILPNSGRKLQYLIIVKQIWEKMCFSVIAGIPHDLNQWNSQRETIPRFVAWTLESIVHVKSRIWRLFWASPSVQLSGLESSASVLLIKIAHQICPTQDNTVSSCLIDTECDPYCWRTSSSQLQNPTSHSTLILFETNYWVQVDVWSTQRVVDELRTQKVHVSIHMTIYSISESCSASWSLRCVPVLCMIPVWQDTWRWDAWTITPRIPSWCVLVSDISRLRVWTQTLHPRPKETDKTKTYSCRIPSLSWHSHS